MNQIFDTFETNDSLFFAGKSYQWFRWLKFHLNSQLWADNFEIYHSKFHISRDACRAYSYLPGLVAWQIISSRNQVWILPPYTSASNSKWYHLLFWRECYGFLFKLWELFRMLNRLAITLPTFYHLSLDDLRLRFVTSTLPTISFEPESLGFMML